MNNKLTLFQAIMFGVLIVAIIAGVILFSFQRQKQNAQSVPVSIWGTIDSNIMSQYFDAVNARKQESISANYTYVERLNFESTLVKALAEGAGPDIILVPDDLILTNKNRIYPINYEYYPQRDYKDNFIENSEILLIDQGAIGVPFIVDPLVLYWNRTILNNEGIPKPPAYWDEFLTLVPKLVDKDASLRIENAAIALGEFKNVQNAKEIFITMMMQAGNPIVAKTSDPTVSNKEYESVFSERLGYKVTPAETAINFFTQFSNPSRDIYTWNRSLPEAKDMFLAGDMAFYIGFASELEELRLRNPNLNFDVAVLPQSRSGEQKIVFGRLHSLAVMKNSPNLGPAITNIITMTSAENLADLVKITNLPPVRRDLLTTSPEFSYLQTFYDSALISKSFLDPEPETTYNIFRDMIESYISGRERLGESIQKTDQKLKDQTK